jgi:hypothetical protein
MIDHRVCSCNLYGVGIVAFWVLNPDIGKTRASDIAKIQSSNKKTRTKILFSFNINAADQFKSIHFNCISFKAFVNDSLIELFTTGLALRSSVPAF